MARKKNPGPDNEGQDAKILPLRGKGDKKKPGPPKGKKPLRGDAALKAAQAAERQIEALRLRSQGYTYDQVAEILGYETRSGAWKAVQSQLQSQRYEAVQELREIEGYGLDQLERAHFPLAVGLRNEEGELVTKPDSIAADTILKVKARRARLFGLDMPTRVQTEVLSREAVDDEIKRLLTEIAALEASPRKPRKEPKK